MAVRIMVEEGLEIGGFDAINVSVDVLVRRVWERLRLVRKAAPVSEFHAVARTMHSRFPGKLDEPSWLIGRGWCDATDRQCRANGDGNPCPLMDLCIAARTGKDPVPSRR